jgi:hypothetical protein
MNRPAERPATKERGNSMSTTDIDRQLQVARRGIDWLRTRGLEPGWLYTSSSGSVTLDLPRATSLDEFVRVARQFGATEVDRRGDHLWAALPDHYEGFDVSVFAGDCWKGIPDGERDAAVELLRERVLAVSVGSDDETSADAGFEQRPGEVEKGYELTSGPHAFLGIEDEMAQGYGAYGGAR